MSKIYKQTLKIVQRINFSLKNIFKYVSIITKDRKEFAICYRRIDRVSKIDSKKSGRGSDYRGEDSSQGMPHETVRYIIRIL